MGSHENGDYRWNPAPGDWDHLRSLENAVAVAQWPQAEVPALIERTFECLGFSKREAEEFAGSEAGQRKYVAEAATRIREGSKRLSNALLAPPAARQELLEAIAKSEPVLFYRELAQSHLAAEPD